jgi:chemotaxis protein MotB
MGRDWSYDREGDHEGGGKERWLVTYADLITLMMVFFLVMYALAPKGVNENFEKLKASLSTSLKKTTNPKIGEKDAYVSVGTKQDKELRATQEQVVDTIVTQDPKGNRDVKVEVDERGLVVSLIDTSFFDPGSATLKPNAVKLLRGMAAAFLKQTNEVRVEGHTDNVPIHTAQFASNWELSASRAAAVVRLLNAQGVVSSRLSAVGYAETKPLQSNGTPEGRKRNRRVEIVLVRAPEATHKDGKLADSKPDATPAPAKQPDQPFKSNGMANPFEKGGFKNPFSK